MGFPLGDLLAPVRSLGQRRVPSYLRLDRHRRPLRQKDKRSHVQLGKDRMGITGRLRLIHRSGVKTVLAGRLRFLRTIAQNNKGAYVGPFVIHNFARSLIAR